MPTRTSALKQGADAFNKGNLAVFCQGHPARVPAPSRACRPRSTRSSRTRSRQTQLGGADPQAHRHGGEQAARCVPRHLQGRADAVMRPACARHASAGRTRSCPAPHPVIALAPQGGDEDALLSPLAGGIRPRKHRMSDSDGTFALDARLMLQSQDGRATSRSARACPARAARGDRGLSLRAAGCAGAADLRRRCRCCSRWPRLLRRQRLRQLHLRRPRQLPADGRRPAVLAVPAGHRCSTSCCWSRSLYCHGPWAALCWCSGPTGSTP